MEKLPELFSLDDIKLLVDTFYDRIRHHTLLGPIFNDQIQDKWPEHLNKMYAFWQTVLLGASSYMGSPFPPHANLPVNQEHFAAWLQLFTETIDELFTGSKADEAKWRAAKMAEMFAAKIDHLRKNPLKII